MEIHAQNARDALVATARAVLEYGEEVSPRGLRTRELEHFTVRIDDPTDWHCSGINAGWGPKVATLEALQLVGGFSSPELVREHTPGVAGFTNDVGEFDGAYGPRAVRSLPYVVKRLRDDPDTRQAVIPIWDFTDATRPSSKDFPCTCALGFSVRRGALSLSVAMRSNDLNFGLKHDVSQFSILLCTVAAALGLPVGEYRHTAFSMHLYEKSWDWAEGLDDAHLFDEVPGIPKTGVSAPTGDVREAMTRATFIAYDLPIENETDAEAWFRKTLYG